MRRANRSAWSKTTTQTHPLRPGDSDAVLADPEPLLKWFDERKITGPRKEFDLNVKLEEQADKDEKRWLAAMPPH